MAEYTIQAVAPQTREYDTKFGHMISYKVKFTTEADAVEISQKPETPAPEAGQVLTGDIIDGQYGKKFKKEFSQGGFTQGGSSQSSSASGTSSASATDGGGSRYQRDDSHIKAQWAIGQAISATRPLSEVKTAEGIPIWYTDVEELAKELFAMVDRVKGGSESTAPGHITDGSKDALSKLFPEVTPVDQGELPWNPEG